MTITASVIIPTYHSWPDLQRCLDLLADQTTPSAAFEIIVANNAETDEIPDGFRLQDNMRIIHAPKPGSYAARNAGIAEAKTDLLFFTDADCRPRPDYIENGLVAFDANPGVKRFAGAVELEPATEEWTTPELYDLITALKQEYYASQGRAATANVFARRAAFDEIGLFDDEAMSGGDMEWARRAMALGIEQVYVPDVIVGHPARATFEDHAVKRRRILGAQIRYATPGERRKLNIPPIKRLILPSVGVLRRALREPNITTRQALKLWMFQYRLRRLLVFEQIRLTWFKGQAERR